MDKKIIIAIICNGNDKLGLNFDSLIRFVRRLNRPV